jgi:dTDP-D-glucose 4,6-dehydratase
MPKTILITGANGFIGKNLIRYILESTNMCIIALDKVVGVESDRIKWYCVNLLNKKDFCDITEDFDYVIHLAAIKDVADSYNNIEPYITTNVLGTANLFDWLRTNHCEKIINLSTAAVLGANKLLNTHEQSPYDPVSPYGGSKAAQEMIAATYSNAFKLPVITVRIDTPFGPEQPQKNLIPTMIKNILEDIPVKFYGKNLPFTTDYCSRNWIFVDTISRELLCILENDINQLCKNICHLLGNNKNVTDIFMSIQKCLNPDFNKFEFFNVNENCQTSDQHLHYSLSTIYSDKLGEVSEEEFDNQISETVNWYKKNIK